MTYSMKAVIKIGLFNHGEFDSKIIMRRQWKENNTTTLYICIL